MPAVRQACSRSVPGISQQIGFKEAQRTFSAESTCIWCVLASVPVFLCFVGVFCVWTLLPQLGPDKWSGHVLYAGSCIVRPCVVKPYIYIYIYVYVYVYVSLSLSIYIYIYIYIYGALYTYTCRRCCACHVYVYFHVNYCIAYVICACMHAENMSLRSWNTRTMLTFGGEPELGPGVPQADRGEQGFASDRCQPRTRAQGLRETKEGGCVKAG